MTGFGRAVLMLPQKKITVEVKSLNSKQLDVNIRIPSAYKEKELSIRSFLSSSLRRGKIELSVFVENIGSESTYKINKDLEEIYLEAIYVYRRYMYHVLNIVGGVFETRNSRKKNNINTYKNVSKEKQIDAILFLYENLWKSQFWLTPKKITSKIRPNGIMERIENIQKSSVNRLLSSRKLNQILSSNSTVEGLGLNSKDVINEIEKNIFSNLNPDTSEQNLQVYFVEKMLELIDDKQLHPSIKSFIISLKKNLNKKFKRNSNKSLKAHYEYLYLLTKT